MKPISALISTSDHRPNLKTIGYKLSKFWISCSFLEVSKFTNIVLVQSLCKIPTSLKNLFLVSVYNWHSVTKWISSSILSHKLHLRVSTSILRCLPTSINSGWLLHLNLASIFLLVRLAMEVR